jgi:hypothetical protein
MIKLDARYPDRPELSNEEIDAIELKFDVHEHATEKLTRFLYNSRGDCKQCGAPQGQRCAF